MRKLDFNNSKDLAAFKESFNAVLDREIGKQLLSEKLEGLKGLSFGEYKSLFEEFMPGLTDDVNGKKIIASYVKLIKENKAINAVYKILEGVGLDNCSDTNIASYEIANICEGLDKKMLRNGENKMYDICLKACNLSEGVTCEKIDNILSENKKLNDAVSYLSHSKSQRNMKYINERVDSIKAIGDFINENKGNKVVSEHDKSNKELMSDLNALLENKHSDWENKVLTDISCYTISGADKSELFESYKTDCLNTIENMDIDDDVEQKSRIYGIKQQLTEKQYNAETIIDDLFKLAELNQTLQTL